MGRRFDNGVLRRAFAVLALSSVACMIILSWDTNGRRGADGQLSPLSVGVAGAEPTEAVTEGRWVEMQSPDGRMTTAYLKMPGSRVLGLRGKAVVDHHISAILNVFLNTTMSKQWISYLDHVEEHPTRKRNKHIIYQLFDMPWPLGDREFLMERAVEADRRTKTVTAKYKSVEHPTRKPRKGVVRGENHHTRWSFRSVGGGQTHIEVESQIDAKLPISTWFVSLMQESYQRNSLNAMMDLVSRAAPHPEYAHF